MLGFECKYCHHQCSIPGVEGILWMQHLLASTCTLVSSLGMEWQEWGLRGGLDGVIDAVFKGSWELGYHHSP